MAIGNRTEIKIQLHPPLFETLYAKFFTSHIVNRTTTRTGNRDRKLIMPSSQCKQIDSRTGI